MDTDIVARLRNYDTCSDTDVDEAADEIERLREQLRLANIDNFNTTAEIEQLNIQHREAEPLLNELWERRTEATEMREEIEQQRKILEWLLPQLFRRIYPEYDLGHPHMYTLITAVKQPDGGMPKDMWKTIEPFLDAKP